jgi:hypothetical protein
MTMYDAEQLFIHDLAMRSLSLLASAVTRSHIEVNHHESEATNDRGRSETGRLMSFPVGSMVFCD